MGRIAKYSLLRYVRRKKIVNKVNLPYSITLREDESLYSYIIRVALAFGISPGSFVHSFLPEIGHNIGELDFDISINESQIKALSSKLRIGFEALYKTSLRSFSGILFEKTNFQTTVSFIDALKRNNTTFTGYGYKICPLCTKESLINSEKKAIIKSSYLKKFWRISFYLICPEHQLFLIDRCPQCGTSINFHKGYLQEIFGACFRCGLFYNDFSQVSCKSLSEVLEMFLTLYNVLRKGEGILSYLNNGQPIKAVLYFGLLRNFVRVTQRLMRIHKNYLIKCLGEENIFEIAQEYCNKLSIRKDLRNSVFENKKKFEYLPVEEKLIILKVSYDIFKNFREFVKAYKKELHLTRETLFKHWDERLNFLLDLLSGYLST